MSGIAGVLHLDGRPVERALLEHMVDSLVHRGPDGSGLWSEGEVGLGHQLLRTTPESLYERLPLEGGRGAFVLTADARIDNRGELISYLGLSGVPPEEVADSRLILAAYERWGERCPERLLGDFAFAIWDSRERKLFCARDHMGVKPLYYYSSGRIFAFASEIKALLRLPEVPRRLNELRVAEYLVPTVEDRTMTFYRDILRLPPAHSMTVSRGKLSVRPYWSPDPLRELRLGSDEEYAEAFREVFAEAVRCRLRSTHPVGSELSGGLDSSSVACVAREVLAGGSRRLHTFSSVYDDAPKSDEREFIEEILAGGGMEPHFLRADLLGPLGEREGILEYMDEPSAASLFVNWAQQSLVRQSGVRTVLTGSDGDTVVNHGDLRLVELARSGRWRTLATQIDALSRVTDRPRGGLLKQLVLKPLVPGPALRAWRAVRRRPEPEGPPLRGDFARRVGIEEHIESLATHPPGGTRLSRAAHWRGVTAAVWPYTLELSDKLGAAAAAEYRHPFFDRRLVELCLSLPPEQQLDGGWSRVVLRRAMAGTLSEKVRWRKTKGNQSHGWARSLLAFDREPLERALFEDPRGIEPYVDLAVLRETYQRFVSRGGPQDFHPLVTAAHLAVWLRKTGLNP